MKSERIMKIQETILQATQALALSLSTSYGPKGLDKLITQNNKSLVTNDGATILGYYKNHPIHRILANLSKTQDFNCGDGTTSVVLLTCKLMEELGRMLEKNIHPCRIVEGIEVAKKMALEYIDDIKTKIGENEIMNAALTALNSKIAAKSVKMASAVVDALKEHSRENIKIIKTVGGSIEDIEMTRSIIIKNESKIPSGRYKVAVLAFSLSSPKTNMDAKIVINDESLVEKFVKEERDYLIGLVRRVRQSGANLVVIQKSMLKESCSDLAKHLLNKLGIQVVNSVGRKDIEYFCRMTGLEAASEPDLIGEPVEMDILERENMIEFLGYGCSIIISGCDELIVDEAERAMNDVFGVVGALNREPYVVPGGGSVEAGIAGVLERYNGPHSFVLGELSKGILAMPYCLAQNAGINAIEIVSQLRKHISVNHNMGISLRTGTLADMVNIDKIIQPAAVSKSMILLAFETVQVLVRVDDILPAIQ